MKMLKKNSEIIDVDQIKLKDEIIEISDYEMYELLILDQVLLSESLVKQEKDIKEEKQKIEDQKIVKSEKQPDPILFEKINLDEYDLDDFDLDGLPNIYIEPIENEKEIPATNEKNKPETWPFPDLPLPEKSKKLIIKKKRINKKRTKKVKKEPESDKPLSSSDSETIELD